MYRQNETPATLEQLQGELKALREEVQWLRSQLAMRVTFYQPQTTTTPPSPGVVPPLYISNAGGYYG